MEGFYTASDVLSNMLYREQDIAKGGTMQQESFGVWLARQLRRREWTQADLARQTGISSGRISEWVRGTRLPNSESAIRLADALHEDADHVLALSGHRPNAFAEDDPETAAVVATVRNIRWTEARDPIRTMLEQMAEYDRRTAATK
jgi:transcriptional regulator with XRE-family HTH domain